MPSHCSIRPSSTGLPCEACWELLGWTHRIEHWTILPTISSYMEVGSAQLKYS